MSRLVSEASLTSLTAGRAGTTSEQPPAVTGGGAEGPAAVRVEGKEILSSWVALPFAGERLESVVQFGNGKDSELKLAFTDGRRVVLPVSAVRVEVDRGIVVDVSSWDDVSLRITYAGANLTLHSGRFGLDGGDEELSPEFVTDAESWIATGCRESLPWVVHVAIHLTSV